MRRECRERFPRHRLQKKPIVSEPFMRHGTCAMHVPWCVSISLSRSLGENVPGISGACATRNFTYLARCPWRNNFRTTDPLRGESTGLRWIPSQTTSEFRCFHDTHMASMHDETLIEMTFSKKNHNGRTGSMKLFWIHCSVSNISYHYTMLSKMNTLRIIGW